MNAFFSRLSLLWKIVLSTSVGITALSAVTGWIAVRSATRATSESVTHEVQASLRAYQSLWKSRADRLSSIAAILSGMSDVRAAFSTGDEATIRDSAGELWSRVSDEDAFFIVASPSGRVIASLGGAASQPPPRELPVVREAASRFPAQVSGFLARGSDLFHITVTPVYVQAGEGTGLLNVLVAGYAVNHDVAERLKTATGGSEFLFLSGGRVVASTVPAAGSAAIAAQLAASPLTVRHKASEYASLVTPLADINGNTVGQLAILRSFDAVNLAISGLRRDISVLWLISLVAGLGLTYLSARRIVEPVKELDRAAAEVARRNYNCKVVVTSEDELGRLAATFNGMCASIRAAREELIRSERIATIGRLATSIVHDLRNPLAAIYGGAEMMMGSKLSEAHSQRLARNMYGASVRIQELLQDLLDLCRGKTGQPEPSNLRDLVLDAVDKVAAAAESQSVRIAEEIPEDMVVPLDRRRIDRVLANLLANALEAMPGGGSIRISAMPCEDSVLVEVRDTGPGIAPEIRDRLFQPFVTARKGGGLGLGLAFSRQAIIDHGGEMWAESLPGQGACFSFPLPRAAGEPVSSHLEA